MNFIKKLSLAEKIKHSVRFALFVIFIGACLSLLPRWYQKGFSKPEARASGVTLHVCTSGCSYTSIAAALEHLVDGDTVIVDPTYVSTDEPFTNGELDINRNSITIDCQSNPVTIGYSSSTVLYITTFKNNTVIENCSFKNVFIQVNNGENTTGFTFTNNSFDQTSSSSIFINAGPLNSTSQASNFTISNNTNINNLIMSDSLATGTISNNIFYNIGPGAANIASVILLESPTSSNITFTSNTFYATTDSSSQTFIGLNGDGISFVSNTIHLSNVSTQVTSVISFSGIGLPGMPTQGNYVFTGNRFEMPNDNSVGHSAFNIASGVNLTTNVIISHNIIFFPLNSSHSTNAAIKVFDNSRDTAVTNVTSTYNILYSPIPSASQGFEISKQSALSSISFYNDYNGIYNFASPLVNSGAAAGTYTLGSNTRLSNPLFVSNDPFGSNNLSLMPFSNYLDVFGDIDIGTVTGTRRNTVSINAAGPVDYTTIDATTTAFINDFVRSGDTITIADGRYPSFSVSSTFATTSVTIQSVGSNAIVNASTSPIFAGMTNFNLSGLTFNLFADSVSGDYNLLVYKLTTSTFFNLQFLTSSSTPYLPDVFVQSSDYLTFTSTTFANLNVNTSSSIALFLGDVRSSTFRNIVASGTTAVSSTYRASAIEYSYNGTDYNVTGGSGYQQFFDTTQSLSFASSVGDVSSILGIGQSDINIALASANAGSLHVTIFVANSQFSTPQTLETFLHNFAADGQIDAWIPSAFVVSNGSYTYDADAVADADVTPISGFTDPPTIKHIYSSPGSIKLVNSSNNLFDASTSTNNGIGISFAGSSSNNIVSTSVFSSNLGYDVESSATGDNILKNITFNVASTTVTGLGNLNFYFKIRALVQKRPFTPLAGVDTVFTSNSGSPSVTLTTDNNGYTPFTDFLLAIVMTSSSNAITSGGYNPYTASISAGPSYDAGSIRDNIIQGNQTMYLFTLPTTTPIAPSAFTATAVSTSSVSLTWTDNSSGLGQETNFILGRITGISVRKFPGTVFTIPADSTATTTGQLLTNTRYTFRIAGTNSAGTSAYTTSSPVYTLASKPDAPTTASPSETTLQITIHPADNPTTTEFAIYNASSSVFLDASGASNSVTPVWQTTSTWGASVTASGLPCHTATGFSVLARNGDGIRAATSSLAWGTTSSCVTLPPAAPTNFTTTSFTATTASFSWTDNSSGFSQELYFVLDYILGNSSSDFPGTVSHVDQDSTATTTFGFLPNTQYTFRLASYNVARTSAYATGTPFFTLAYTPSAPTVNTVSKTSLSVTFSTNGNPGGTEYAVYNATDNVFIDTDGSINGTTPVWRAATSWSPGNLLCGTPYSFAVIARNGDGIRTATSTSSNASTSSCGGGAAPGSTGAHASGGWYNQPIYPLDIITQPSSQIASSSATDDNKISTSSEDIWVGTARSLFINQNDSFKSFMLGESVRYTYGFKNNSLTDANFTLARSVRDSAYRDVRKISQTIFVQKNQTILKLGKLDLDSLLSPGVYSVTFSVSSGGKSLGTVSFPITVVKPASSNTPVKSVVFSSFLKQGSKGAEVMALQKKLTALGFYKGKINGIFGADTKQAVIRLQIKHALKPALGYVGPGTRDVLNSK